MTPREKLEKIFYQICSTDLTDEEFAQNGLKIIERIIDGTDEKTLEEEMGRKVAFVVPRSISLTRDIQFLAYIASE